MAQVHETIEIQASPDQVWSVAGDPGRIGDWLPALAGSTVEGDRRTCTTEDGAELEERILEHSNDQHYYTYEITRAPFPVTSYRSRLGVEGHHDHSHVTWEAHFEAESPGQEAELVETFSDIYRQGLENLRANLEGASVA